MRNRRSILVLLLAIAFLVFALFAVRPSRDGRVSAGRRQTLVEAPVTADTLTVERRGNAALVFRRDEESGWRIVEPFSGRADEQAVARLLDALSLTPVVDVVADGELVRLGRTRADFSLADPVIRVSVGGARDGDVVSFGMPTPSADGVYAEVRGIGAVFVVPADVLSAVDRPMEAFRRRDIFAVGTEAVSSFVLRQGTGASLSFVREKDGWKVDGEMASATRVESFLSELLSARAVGFVWPVGASNETERVSASLLAGYGLEPESAVTVTLKGLDGADRQLSLGRMADPGLVYASVQNGSSVVTVKDGLKVAALQKKSAFTDSRLFPVAEASVGFFRLVDGDCSYVLARSADGAWRLESPVSALAEPPVVRRFLSRLLALQTSATAGGPKGFSVSIAADAEPVCVPRELVLGDDRLDDLRAIEMVNIDPRDVRRLVRTPGGKAGRPVSVVRGQGGNGWSVESSDGFAGVKSEVVEGVLKTLSPLMALRVEKLKVPASDLDGYGLGVPFLTIAVDLDREDAVRRNILIGAKVRNGRFATVGSADAVFVISDETVERLSAEPVGR